MALSIGSQILEAIRQRKLQGSDPDSPMSERLPSGDNSIDVAREPLPPLTGDYNTMTRNLAPPSEFDRPVRGVPLSDDSSLRSVDMARGMPVQDHSGTQFLQTPPSVNQLDSSNLAGPVPTTLNGPGGVGPAISNADGSMLGLTGAIPAQQAATTPGVTLSPNAQALHDPERLRLALTPANKTISGLTEKSIDDPGIQSMGRGASFGRAFQQSMMNGGGIVHALESGVMGLVDPDYGKQAAVNVKNRQFYMQKQKEQDIQSRDPVLRDALQVATNEAELPARKDLYQTNQTVATGNKITLANINNDARLSQIQKRGENQQAAITTRQNLKNTGDLDGLRALYTGMIDPETGKKFTVDDADQAARSDLMDQKTAKTEKLWNQADAADALTKLRTAQTVAVPQRIDQSERRLKGFLDNVETNRARLQQAGASAAEKQQNDDLGRQLTALNSRVGVLKNQATNYTKVLNDPYSSEDAKKLAQSELDRVNGEQDDIDKQERQLTSAPAKGQPGVARPKGGQQSGKVVGPAELKSYADANFGGDLGKAKEAYMHHARQRGITITFQ